MFTAGSVMVEEESIQKTDGVGAQLYGEEHPVDERRGEQRGMRWPVWLLAILILLLLVSNIANLVVSQRAYESSQKQAKAIEQMAQSIKDVQKSIMNLSRMIEQPPPEDEEHEDDRGNGVLGADSI
jgi:hypothetical protein